MTAPQPQLSFPSEPIVGETAAVVELVGEDWRAENDWTLFQWACQMAAGAALGYVNPNEVRRTLTSVDGDLDIEPRRYSAFWHRAAKGKDAFLVADGWVLNTDHAGGNAGKPLRRYRLRGDA